MATIEQIPPAALRPGDDDVLARIGNEAFPTPWAEPVEHWSPNDYRFVMRDEGGQIVSSISLVQRHVRVGAVEVDVVGIGGVMTALSARGQGHAGNSCARLPI